MDVLKFTAKWCGPCKTLNTQLKAIGLFIREIDVDTPEAKPLLAKYGIKSIPTIVIDSGTSYKVLTGPLTPERQQLLTEVCPKA